jgi:hypothetical protein
MRQTSTHRAREGGLRGCGSGKNRIYTEIGAVVLCRISLLQRVSTS